MDGSVRFPCQPHGGFEKHLNFERLCCSNFKRGTPAKERLQSAVFHVNVKTQFFQSHSAHYRSFLNRLKCHFYNALIALYLKSRISPSSPQGFPPIFRTVPILQV